MAQSTLEMRVKHHGGKRAGAGRKGDGKWHHLVSMIKAALDALGLVDSPKNVRSVIRDRRVKDPLFYEGVREATLSRYYFRYRNRPTPIPSKQSTISQTALAPANEPALPPTTAPADFGRQLFLMQKWGKLARPPLGAEEALQLITSLYAAAGPHRPVGRIFDMIGRRYGIVDHEKVEWLRLQVREMANDPQYYPRSRPGIVNRTNLDAVLKIVKEAPGSKADIAYIMRKSRKSRDSVVNLTRRLVGEGELVRVVPGVFVLPGLGEAHIPAHKAVMAIIEAAPPGMEFKAVELAKMLGRSRQAIDGALHGRGALVADGRVMCVRRGVFVGAAFPRPIQQ
jgi:hypothetical protein